MSNDLSMKFSDFLGLDHERKVYASIAVPTNCPDGPNLANSTHPLHELIRNRFSGDASGDGGNTIRGNTISKNTTKGIRLFYADGNRVEANNVWGTTGDGTKWGMEPTTNWTPVTLLDPS